MAILRDKRFWLAAALYTGLALYFLPIYRYQLDPDGISYLLLAQKYARGEVAQALNATWQPLFPLLLAPWLALGIEAVLAGKLLLIACGIFVLAAARVLSSKIRIQREIQDVLLFTLVPVVLQFTFVMVSPDLLLTALVLLYFAVIADPAYPSGLSPIRAGILGGLAFLAKAYALPFFIAHFVLLHLFDLWRNGRWKRSLTALGYGAAVFLVITAAWSGLVSIKYGRFTVSSAIGFNVSAALSGGGSVPPGFFAPPNPTAVSVWEDPGLIRFTSGKRQAMDLIERQARIILKNMKESAGILIRFSPVSMAVLILGCAALCSRKTLRSDPSSGLLLLSAALFIAGYMPVNIEVRYIWPALVVLVILAFKFVSILIDSVRRLDFRKEALLLLVSAAFITLPLNKMQFTLPETAGLQKMRRQLEASGIRGRIASNGAWIQSLYLAYFLNSSYYGAKPGGMKEQELLSRLEDFEIDYYFVWPFEPVPSFLKGTIPIEAEGMERLRVYRMNKE